MTIRRISRHVAEVFDPRYPRLRPCCGRRPRVTIVRSAMNGYEIRCDVCNTTSEDAAIWDWYHATENR
jgi:hypothetical protein